jgi:hypothetical protein
MPREEYPYLNIDGDVSKKIELTHTTLNNRKNIDEKFS